MKRHFIIQYLFFQFMTLAASESYYSIIAPGVIKSNRKYSVAVTLHAANGPCSIRVAIEGPAYNVAQDINLMQFESKLVTFLPNKLLNGDYKLTAEGLTGLSFKNESVLFVDGNYGPKIYIQTDKAIYKPQDLVQFRILILDEHTRPLSIEEPVRVEILDRQNNRVKQFKDVTLVKGVYTGKFQLSEYPVLGGWKINVILSGRYGYSNFKEITIRDYVLPKFSVYLKTPSYFFLEDGFIKAVFYGKYTFNKYVDGNATVELWDHTHKLILQKKQIDIENIGFVEFQIDSSIKTQNVTELFIVAKIAEKNTGITEIDKKHVRIQEERYYISIPYDEIEFDNNKPYRLKAYLRYWTGATVLDRKMPVIMKHGEERYEAFLDEYGTAIFEFKHDANANHEFQYKNSKKIMPNIFISEKLMLNKTEFYCRLKLVEGRLKLGRPVTIEVSSVANIPYLKYIMMGHASLIRMEHIKVPPNQKSFIIHITPTIEMIPVSYIYVYYVHKGNLRYEEMKLRFPDEFENKILLEAPKQVKPGEDVTISIKAQPKSYVSIMAVDLGVYLLDSSYDLNRAHIMADLQFEQSYIPLLATVYPGLISGVITLTNAHYPFESLDGISSAKGLMPKDLRFRKKFPETWIFQNLEINETNTQLTLPIPDAVTTWRITAFSNNAITGFGIVDGPTDITTIQPFFISLNLPNSVKRGEIVVIPVTIFNYLNQSLDTEVVLYNTDKAFYFMESRAQGVVQTEDDQQKIEQVTIPSNKGKTVKFLVNPLKVGEINIKISASSSLYSDAVVQKLKVELDGVAKQQSQALYLSVPADEKLSSSLMVDIPIESVPDSEYITFAVGGDYLVPSVEKFDDLIQLPTGSGDQNMVNFAPNVLILQYLRANGSLYNNKELVKKLRAGIEIAYQQQLSFRHQNGGFSMFGENTDEEASTWITAYVMRYFIKASRYSYIEPRIIETGLDYLAQQQKPNGEFSFTGYLLNPGHKNKFGFTAFVLLAFLENHRHAMKYRRTVENGLEFLNSNLNKVDDINALSMMAAALKLARNKNANAVIDRVKLYGKELNGLRWWSGGDWNHANDIEITAYAAMAIIDTPGDHTPILKWLIEQRNSNGGFTSTLNTVVGLEALVKFSEKYKNLDYVNLKISYSAKDHKGIEVMRGDLFLDSNKASVLQKRELPKSTRHISFDMEGMGTSLVQLSYQYNIDNDEDIRHFIIKPKADLKNSEELDLEICFTYLSESNESDDTTNMIIMEANLPSGYRSDAEYSSSLVDNDLVQRIQSKNSESTIILHLDSLAANVNHCLNISADKMNDVLTPKAAAIIMYDYYNLTRSNTKFYTL